MVQSIPQPHPEARTQGTRSQTLDRGLQVLQALRDAGGPMSIAALATTLGVHRSIVYRMVRTLEDHRLVARTSEGNYELGLGLPSLARGVSHSLQSAATPVLTELANETRMTAFIVVPAQDEAVTLLTVEPRHSMGHVAYAPGMRHPINRGAPGMAMLSALPPTAEERPEVSTARERGWAYSHSEVLAGMSAVAAPVATRTTLAAVAVVYLETRDRGEAPLRLGERVHGAARDIVSDLP
ncbi:IclR family transcriptional regulator [Lipingzhangella sp. LS1_29]|uniref:IclR family transcriptional regulator n=1 Tax=Lipingzhangella rawalii TaxID=2055835 RepID=A0ABU2H6N6_9ACTN|nr:IclR family transcriptional regulator [Lipingzhangella rawalii]MDS1270968.1 IclR family transcriptional regulator [Lipingzhangella rawalii]